MAYYKGGKYFVGGKEVSYEEYDTYRTYMLIGGYKIVGFRYTEEGYPEIEIEKDNHTQYILISQDAEGNGPGEFFVELERTE